MGTWSLRPNSVMPPSMLLDLPNGGGSVPVASIIDAWNTGCHDTSRDRYVLTRLGGHADGAHNGVRAYEHGTGSWSFLCADSLAYAHNPGAPVSAFTPLYADGSPAAVHSYDAICYMPPPFDAVWTTGGIYWSPPGYSPAGSHLFEFSTNAYRTIPNRPGGYGCFSVWDPVEQRVLFHTSGGFYAYTPSSTGGPGTYTTFYTSTSMGIGTSTSTLALDAQGRKLYFVNRQTVAPFSLRMIDLNNVAAKAVKIPVGGNTAIHSHVHGPGLIWDQGLLISYGPDAAGTAGTIYTLDPTVGSPVWTRLDTTGGLNAQLPSINGTWKKFYKSNDGAYNFLARGGSGATATMHQGIFTTPAGGGTLPPVLKKMRVATDLQVDYVPDDPLPEPGVVPPNQWVFIPTKPAGSPKSSRMGKHMRAQWDENRNKFYIAGGDRRGSSGGQPAVETYDPVTGQFTIVSPMCVPAPGLMPNFPDNVGWVRDTKRDRYHMFKGFYTLTRHSEVMNVVLTPEAATGTDVLFTMAAGETHPFASWMVSHVRSDGGIGLRIRSTSGANNSGTILGEAVIKTYLSPTQVRADITPGKPFDAGPVAATFWVLSEYHRGDASRTCGRNEFAGDAGVMSGTDCTFNPQTNLWERPTWPPNPLGSSDAAGPTWAIYHEATDSVFLIKDRTTLLWLHMNETPMRWETIPFAQGMPTGPARDIVAGASSFRSQIVLADDKLYHINLDVPQGLIEFDIATKTWNAWAMPAGYAQINPASEPQLAYDPVQNVFYHPWHYDLTGAVEKFYIFRRNTQDWIVDPMPFPYPGTPPEEITERRDEAGNLLATSSVAGGCAEWDPLNQSLILFSRQASGVPGNFCWHYRYDPAVAFP